MSSLDTSPALYRENRQPLIKSLKNLAPQIFIPLFAGFFFVAALPFQARSEEIDARINIAINDRIVFYLDMNTGLKYGGHYDVYSLGRKLGEIEVIEIRNSYTTARAVSGYFPPYEGMNVLIVPAAEPAPAPDVPGLTGEDQEPAPDAIEAPGISLSRMKVFEEEEEEKEPEPEKGKEEPRKRTPSRARTRTPSRDTGGEDETDASSAARLRRDKRAQERTERVRLDERSAGTSAPPPQKSTVNSYVLKVESHSGDTAVETSVTGVFSNSRINNKQIWTYYGLYNANFPDEETADTVGLGVNYSRFYNRGVHASAGLGYISRNEDDDDYYNYASDSEREDSYGFLSVNVYKRFEYEDNNPNYYRLSAGYTAHTDFDEGQAYTLGANYYIKRRPGERIDINYKYLYSLDYDEHIYNKYTIDYTFPWHDRKNLKVTLGYQHVEYPYITDSEDDTDDVFRFILYSSH